MKIIYDNIIYSLQKAGGISTYWNELSSRFKKNKLDITFYGFENENIFANDIKQEKESKIISKFARYLPFLKKLPKKSIFHSSYYRVSNQKDIANITTVHDFTYEYYRNGLAKYIHSLQKGRAIKKSDGIICISENTKKDLIKFYPYVDKNKIEVIYNGISEVFNQLENPSKYLTDKFSNLITKKYILYIGDRSGYKNFNIAVQTLNQLHGYSLVIVGGDILNDLEINSIKNEYFHFQGIASKELNIIYNNAFCLLYPSSYEGFGIPLIEAMRAGCPVVSTNISSIPEVVKDAALLVDEIDANNFIKEILKLENNDFRNKLIAKGFSQAKKYSWDKCADETYEFYKKTLKKKFG